MTVLEGYGATECAPSIASNTRAARRPGSVGRRCAGVEVRIGEERRDSRARRERDARHTGVTRKATRAAFTEDGWYRTGDLGELDDDGFLHLRGRLKDMIVLPSGLNVHPEDVETELLRQDAIADCAVVGAADGTEECTSTPS